MSHVETGENSPFVVDEAMTDGAKDSQELAKDDKDFIVEDEETRPAIESSEFVNDNSIKKELDRLVEHIKDVEILPDRVAELIANKKLNIMILDLKDYDQGYDISFSKYGDMAEIYHGTYPYALSVIEYVRDGEIPYDVFDKFRNYEFPIVNDGSVVCEIRIRFDQEDVIRSHFVLLRRTIQTIDAECLMNCEADKSLNAEKERARLINHYSPDLCLDTDPIVAEIVISNELNQHPFITPYLKDVIQKEKARREKGIILMKKTAANESESASKISKENDNMEAWNFRLKKPTPEEAQLAQSASKLQNKRSLLPYLKQRKICFPNSETFSYFPVKIESFVYEYDKTSKGESESFKNILSITVMSDKEYYFANYTQDKKIQTSYHHKCWPLGDRESLDTMVEAITKREIAECGGSLKLTHHQLYDEREECGEGKSAGKVRIVRQKLITPKSTLILFHAGNLEIVPASEERDEKMVAV